MSNSFDNTSINETYEHFATTVNFYSSMYKIKVKDKFNINTSTVTIKFSLPQTSTYDDSCARILFKLMDNKFEIITYCDIDNLQDSIESINTSNSINKKNKEHDYMRSIVNGKHIYNCIIHLNPVLLDLIPTLSKISNTSIPTCSYDNSEVFFETFFGTFFKNNINNTNNNDNTHKTCNFSRMCSICFAKSVLTTKNICYYDNEYIRVCTNEKCIIDCRTRSIDDIVMLKHKKTIDVSKLFIKLACAALYSKDRFTPYPLVWKDNDVVDNYTDGCDVFKTLKDGYNKTSLEEHITNTLDECSKQLYYDDYKLNNEYPMIYEFVKFIFLNMRMNVGYFDMSSSEYEVLGEFNDIWKNDSIVFNVVHDATQEASFANCNDTGFAFHGSGFHNWYSILCNGLKNYSGTSKMTAGAAYGAGIYLGVQEGTSKGYCRNSNSASSMLAITELKYPSKYSKRNNWCYVVPEEENVIIKYLIYIKKETQEKKDIVKYLTKDYPHFQKQSIIENAGVMSKRINTENSNVEKFIKRHNRSYRKYIDSINGGPSTSDNTKKSRKKKKSKESKESKDTETTKDIFPKSTLSIDEHWYNIPKYNKLNFTDLCISVDDFNVLIYVNYGHNYPNSPPIITVATSSENCIKYNFFDNEFMTIIHAKSDTEDDTNSGESSTSTSTSTNTNTNNDNDNNNDNDIDINTKYKMMREYVELDTYQMEDPLLFNYVDPVMRSNSWMFKYELSVIVKYMIRNMFIL